MKHFKTFAMAILVVILSSQASFSTSLEDPNADLRNAVTKLLLNPHFDDRLDETVRISFFVTADQQLVVLKTDARTERLDQYIKSRMNYHTIDVDDLEVNRVFHLKVHFQLGK